MAWPDEVTAFRTETLTIKEPGLSGADWIGAAPQEGLTHSNGQIADTVAGQLQALYERDGTIPDATETQKGVVEIATAAEIEAGAAGVLVATVARLKAELDRRDASRSQVGAIDNGPALFHSITLTSTATQSIDLRGTNGVPADAKGVYITVTAGSQDSVSYVGISSADMNPNGSLRFIANPGIAVANTVPVPLGTSTNAGKIALRVVAGGDCTGLSVYLNGWWR